MKIRFPKARILFCPTSAYIASRERERERQDSWGGRTAANSCSLVEDRDADATETNLTVPSIKRVTVRGSRVFISIVQKLIRIIRLLDDLCHGLRT